MMNVRRLLVAGLVALAPVVAEAGVFRADDPLLPYAWHLEQIGAPAAWEYSQGSAGVTVAVLDSGVIASTPDLAGRVLPALSALGSNPSGEWDYRHGTWVASALAMGVNNGIGSAGVGNFSILPIQVTLNDATKPEWIAEGIRMAADRGAKVINISQKPISYGLLESAAAYARTKGALTFVSAGNDNLRNPMSGYGSLIFVSGTDRDDQRWVDEQFSTVGSTYGPFVDLCAPAVDIVVADPADPNLPLGYGLISGTSFAAPLAAGAAALAWSINPELTAGQVEAMLYSTAVDLGPAGWDEEYGHGRINLGAVASAAWATVPEPGGLGLVVSGYLLVARRRRIRS